MTPDDDFDLGRFMPYLLNQAAEETSLAFARVYRDRFGMLRTEWRVLFHLGRHGDMTASRIGAMATIHKTKVSRAVRALEQKRFLARKEVAHDRRQEILSLLPRGHAAYRELTAVAADYNRRLASRFTDAEWTTLTECLERLAAGADRRG